MSSDIVVDKSQVTLSFEEARELTSSEEIEYIYRFNWGFYASVDIEGLLKSTLYIKD